MCGIACLINKKRRLRQADLKRYTHAIRHRGPDGHGFATFDDKVGMPDTDNDNFYVGLGHRRLSILDLSDAGMQPMYSEDGNFVIVFNGEIYNYIELREELKKLGHRFHSTCDTEVLLAAYQEWGKECLEKFNGMWSIVILDRAKQELFISRDRIGIKPLYYYNDDEVIAFASEIKQFFCLPSFKKEINDFTCVSYLVTGYENPPETFFKNVYSFPQGHFSHINLKKPHIKPTRFWFPDNITASDCSGAEMIEQIQQTFSDAVDYRLRSDVPVGGCLSGGLDSSAIFVEMKKLIPSQTFSAFSACFDQPDIDERPFMKSVIDRTGSRHFKIFPKAHELATDFDSFLRTHDEPVGSVSMYAQYQVMKRAREAGVPVLLDGQGGDELFSGYWHAYLLNLNYHKNKKEYGFVLKHILSSLLPGGNPALFGEAFRHFLDYKKRASRSLPFDIKEEYMGVVDSMTWHLDAQKLPPSEFRKAEILKVHLPRLLKWEDRNSMAHSIESRVPFLDINLIELILSIPVEKNLNKGWNKYLFRKSMSGKLPKDICWRKDKKGFETPQDKWMREGDF